MFQFALVFGTVLLVVLFASAFEWDSLRKGTVGRLRRLYEKREIPPGAAHLGGVVSINGRIFGFSSVKETPEAVVIVLRSMGSIFVRGIVLVIPQTDVTLEGEGKVRFVRICGFEAARISFNKKSDLAGL